MRKVMMITTMAGEMTDCYISILSTYSISINMHSRGTLATVI
jgi:hypothetical protein